MTNENPDYKSRIEELLSHYEDGRNVFKKARDWNHHLTRAPGSENADVPDNWMELVEKVIGIIAHDKYGLDTYPNQIAIIDSEQMLDLYSSIGMPAGYAHWSYGKARAMQERAYDAGQMGLAYEIVINTNPSIAYCMSQNSPMMQMLVIAHASFGHNSFFKGNHLFRQFTKADEILPLLEKLQEDVARYEEKYGIKEVEKLLDAAHALESHGVNRYTKPPKRTPEEEAARRARIELMRLENYNDVLDRTAGQVLSGEFAEASHGILPDMEENLLRFIASDAPHLQPWQRGLLTRVSEKAQYFYPQRQTQLMNEGWASFWHYTLMTDLQEMDLISDGMYVEFLKSHTNVLTQPDFDSPGYSGINPYALGFAIYRDIRRVCENPTEEDKEWFRGKDILNREWLPMLKQAMMNYRDESFVQEFLSPKVMRDFKLFSIRDDEKEKEYMITSIHDPEGYRTLRDDLASQYRLADREPEIGVARYDFKGDRSVTLQHTIRKGVPVHEPDMLEVLRHFYSLWRHPVILHSVDPEGTIVRSLSIPVNAKDSGPKPGQKLVFNN